MKLEQEIFELITCAVETAKVLGIEELIIDKTGVRGLHTERTCLILFKGELPLPFESIGINRLPTFQQRVNIAKEVENISIDAEVDMDKDVRSLKFKGKGLTINYRCAKKGSITTLKNIAENFFREVPFSEEAIMFLSKGQNAMKAEVFSLISDKEGVRFELLDSNNDVFSYSFADKVELKESQTNELFVYRYPIKVFLPILKFAKSSSINLMIGEKGVLKIIVNGLDIMILPRK